MTKEFIENWLLKLKTYWLNKDIDKVISLFNKTTIYQESPFMRPYTTIEEINKEWQNIKNIDIKEINLRLLALDNYTAIINWHLLQNNEEYDGIYEIKFNKNLECIYFKSWEMVNEE
jgi:hypothetical protein